MNHPIYRVSINRSNLKGPASFLIQYKIFSLYRGLNRDLQILNEMTCQCATVLPWTLRKLRLFEKHESNFFVFWFQGCVIENSKLRNLNSRISDLFHELGSLNLVSVHLKDISLPLALILIILLIQELISRLRFQERVFHFQVWVSQVDTVRILKSPSISTACFSESANW